MSQADTVRVLVVGDPNRPTCIFASTLAGPGDTAVVTELPLGSPGALPRTDSERALRETLRRGAEMATGEVARLVASRFPDRLLNPEIAAHKEAAS